MCYAEIVLYSYASVNLTISDSDNGLSPTLPATNVGILSVEIQ